MDFLSPRLKKGNVLFIIRPTWSFEHKLKLLSNQIVSEINELRADFKNNVINIRHTKTWKERLKPYLI